LRALLAMRDGDHALAASKLQQATGIVVSELAECGPRRHEPSFPANLSIDDVLEELDVVVASIHSAQRQDRETITGRCLKAIRNPHVDILGHPTGRIIGERPPTEIDMERILQACLETGTVVEINANPARLDVNDVYARRAVELGCKLVINCDAHSPRELELAEYGVGVARRGWLTATDVINTRSLAAMLALLKDARKGSSDQ
ncbi:MAG: hypothetical protein ACK4SA_21335, partial [Caldilinea sp.]